MISTSCMYAIRAAAFLARQADRSGSYVPIRTIARELHISFHFLTKILQTLTERGILQSYRGPNGGVALAHPAADITVLDIIDCLDGPNLFKGCVLGLPRCGGHNPCPLHARWATERKRLSGMFARATLAELAYGTKSLR